MDLWEVRVPVDLPRAMAVTAKKQHSPHTTTRRRNAHMLFVYTKSLISRSKWFLLMFDLFLALTEISAKMFLCRYRATCCWGGFHQNNTFTPGRAINPFVGVARKATITIACAASFRIYCLCYKVTSVLFCTSQTISRDALNVTNDITWLRYCCYPLFAVCIVRR
jgi:hypothetical protein